MLCTCFDVTISDIYYYKHENGIQFEGLSFIYCKRNI